MAAEEEHKPRDEQQEPKIPVFTVLKNGAILKNIFIVNNTRSSPQLNPILDDLNLQQEEILIIGRHPDCNVMLTHPSISRFHLKIISNPSLHRLSVIDLSSVHGTWVSEKKIEPWERVELNEGDSLRIGGSSRVYRLHWIPLNEAYDFETPYVSASDDPVEEENEDGTCLEAFEDEHCSPFENESIEEEEAMIKEAQEEEYEDQNSVPFFNEQVEEEDSTIKNGKEEENEGDHSLLEDTEIQSPNFVECIGSLYTEGLGITLKEMPLAPLVSKSPVYLLFDENEEYSESPLKDVGEEKEIQYDGGTLVAESENLILPVEECYSGTLVSASEDDKLSLEQSFVADVTCGHPSPVIFAEGENQELYRTFTAESENLSRSTEEVGLDALISACDDYNPSLKPSFGTDIMREHSWMTFVEGERQESFFTFRAESEKLSTEEFVSDALISACDNDNPRLKSSFVTNIMCEQSSMLFEEGEKQELHGTVRTESENLYWPPEEVVLDAAVSACDDDNMSSKPSFVKDVICGQQSPMIFAGCAKQESFRSFGAESENLCVLVEEDVSGALIAAFNDDIHSLEPSSVQQVTCERQSSLTPEEKSERESDNHLIGPSDSSLPKGRTENQTTVGEDGETKSFLASGLIGERENEHINGKDLMPKDFYAVQFLSKGKQGNEMMERQPSLVAEYNSANSIEVSPFKRLGESDEQNESAKDHHPRNVQFEHGSPCIEESVNSSFTATEIDPEFENNKENQTPKSVFAASELPNLEDTVNSAVRLDKKPSSGSIWSRRGKCDSAIQLRMGGSRTIKMADFDATDESILNENFFRLNEEDKEIFTPDKENLTPNALLMKSSKKKSKSLGILHLRTGKEEKAITKDNISCLSGDEGEIFTPDKENFTPNTFRQKVLKKKGIFEEAKNSKPSRSSPLKSTCNPTMFPEEDLVPSPENQNQTLRVLQELKPAKRSTSGNQARLKREALANKTRQERVPFQSLAVTVGNTRPEALGSTSATRSNLSVDCTRTVKKNITNQHSNNSVNERKKAWTMVADITTLLNKESRKKLQLLQGLKGTRLIIPRMVMRELDCLRRRGSLFRRKTEACLVLEWIDQCMVETTSWIHMQSLAEDIRLTAPTPPAFPHSLFSDGSVGFSKGTTSPLPFLHLGGLTEVLSPTTDDHILECALLCRKLNIDEQLVLLSNDISLKVKAMAQGVICETVHEFRESLINPFSERFLWANSSPRGQTWSVMDDVVLREKYNHYPLRKSLKGESAKGLKLILLHNAHYGQRTPIS